MTDQRPTTPTATDHRSGRPVWGYIGGALGGAVSVAANVAHSFVPPAGWAPTTTSAVEWSPPVGAVVGAVFWPVALFVTVEMLARTAWPDGARWVLVRLLGLLPVAGVAAVVSYGHLSGLLRFYRESALTVAAGPLAVDGLMVMSAAALIAAGRTRPADRVSAAVAAHRDEVDPIDLVVDPVDAAEDVLVDRSISTGQSRPVGRLWSVPTGSGRPTGRAGGDHTAAAVANAATLRARFSDQLPTTGRAIRSATGWSADRVSAAVAAHAAGADLADRTTDQIELPVEQTS